MINSRQRNRRRSLLGALVATSLVLAACGGDDDDTTTAPDTTAPPDAPDDEPADEPDDEPDDEPADEPDEPDEPDDDPADEPDDEPADEPDEPADVCTDDRRGGEVTITGRGLAATMDTYLDIVGTIQVGPEGNPFYLSMVYLDSETGDFTPLVAEALEPNDDATEWTLTLREGVEFGNGDPLDAAAMIAHLDRHLGEGTSSRVGLPALEFIAGYEAIGDMQVRFDLHSPYGGFPSLMSLGSLGSVQNVALLEEIGEQAFQTMPVGGGVGPYEIVEHSAPERVVLEAKENWWGGPVCIERLVFEYIPDPRSNFDAFRLGETDVMYFNRDAALLAQAEAEFPGQFSRNMFNNAFMAMPNVGLGNYDGPLTDIRVRQAIAHAIDPEIINQRAWGGDGWGGKGLVHPDSVTISGTEGLPYDPDRARALLDEYKAETGWDGRIEGIAAGTPPTNQEAALTVAALLEAVGFDVVVNADMDVVPLITRVIVEHDFELVLSWGMINGEQQMYSGLRAWASDNPGNQNGFAGEMYDAALLQLRQAVTPEEYQAALDAVQEAINEELPYIVYGADLGSTLYNDDIRGIVWHNGIDPMLHRAYLADAG